MFWSGIADEAGKPIDVQIRAHKELGFDHIELRQVNDSTITYCGDDEFKEIHDKLNDAGIQVSCFASALCNWARDISDPMDEDVKELKTAIPRMQAMGTKFIRIMSYVNNKGLSDADWRAEALRRLKELATRAEDGGIILVHENCHGWGSLTPENMNAMAAEVDSPALKFVFDTGNSTGPDRTSWDFYQKLDKDQIVYVHIKDMLKDGGATWPGEGDSGVENTLRDLFARGYDGGLSLEPHIAAVVHTGASSDPETMYNSYVEYGKRARALVERIKAG